MHVRPGWFVVRRISKTTGAEKRPKLWRCPGGIASCPGGASITEVMGVLHVPPATKTAARTCESIANSTPGMSEEDFKAVRLLQYPQCQCSKGGTGMLCRTCKSADIVGGKDWVAVRGSGCSECSIGSADARSLVAVTTLCLLLLVLCIVLGLWRYTRPSIMEERFIDAFRGIEDGGKLMVRNFFGVAIGSGISQEVFVAAVLRRCGGGGGNVKETASTKAHALALWSKLDENDVRNELEKPMLLLVSLCLMFLQEGIHF